jgi:hypothetical protein
MLMLLLVAFFDVQASSEAANDILLIYSRVNGNRIDETEPFQPERVARQVEDDVFSAADKTAFPLGSRMFSRIVRTVAYQVQSQRLQNRVPETAELQETIRGQLFRSTLATWLLNVMVVLFFPVMLISLV